MLLQEIHSVYSIQSVWVYLVFLLINLWHSLPLRQYLTKLLIFDLHSIAVARRERASFLDGIKRENLCTLALWIPPDAIMDQQSLLVSQSVNIGDDEDRLAVRSFRQVHRSANSRRQSRQKVFLKMTMYSVMNIHYEKKRERSLTPLRSWMNFATSRDDKKCVLWWQHNKNAKFANRFRWHKKETRND